MVVWRVQKNSSLLICIFNNHLTKDQFWLSAICWCFFSTQRLCKDMGPNFPTQSRPTERRKKPQRALCLSTYVIYASSYVIYASPVCMSSTSVPSKFPYLVFKWIHEIRWSSYGKISDVFTRIIDILFCRYQQKHCIMTLKAMNDSSGNIVKSKARMLANIKSINW